MDLLLERDVYPQIMLTGFWKDSKNALITQRTVFGWVVIDKMSQSNSVPFRSESPTDLSICPPGGCLVTWDPIITEPGY